jgi:hypothetical protein
MMTNTSFIVPFYRKLRWLKIALHHNAECFAHCAEIVLVLDEPSEEKEVLEVVKAWPQLKFLVIVNDEDHTWRPPTKAINAGIHFASSHRIAVISPETILRLPSPGYLEQLVIDGKFYTGVLRHMSVPEDLVLETANPLIEQCWLKDLPRTFGFGFIMAAWNSFKEIGGYDENRKHYGGDDDCVRMRLLRHGYTCVVDPHIHLLHPAHVCSARDHAKEPLAKEVKFLETPAFSRIAWNWKEHD